MVDTSVKVLQALAAGRFDFAMTLCNQQLLWGNLDEAEAAFRQLGAHPAASLLSHCRVAQIARRKRALQKPVAGKRSTNDSQPWSIVWQAPREPAGGIVRFLLGGVEIAEEIDDFDVNAPEQHLYSKFARRMIVVDHVLRSKKSVEYYTRASRDCERVILIHLADELYADPQELYLLVDLVIRNYHLPVSGYSEVISFPLGDNSSIDFPDVDANKPLPEREYWWSFVGDISKKPHRESAIMPFQNVPRGFLYTVHGFHSPDKLSALDYREILSDTVFAVCPSGFCGSDTFRFWEALEFGAIPLILDREWHYFQRLCQESVPVPHFESWQDAAIFAREISEDTNVLMQLENTVRTWWRAKKTRWKLDVAAAIKAVDSRLY